MQTNSARTQTQIQQEYKHKPINPSSTKPTTQFSYLHPHKLLVQTSSNEQKPNPKPKIWVIDSSGSKIERLKC